MINILIDHLPETVRIDGLNYPINTDFRASILFEELMNDYELDNKEKIIAALKLYYPILPNNLSEALEQALWFYSCGKYDGNTSKEQDEEESKTLKRPVYSFEHDAPLIYAAFYSQYLIDLQKEKLHWWQFRALFDGLKDDHRFVQIVGYRSMEITSKMSAEQANFYRKMQKKYELPLPKNLQEQQNALEAALLGDGDLRGIL